MLKAARFYLNLKALDPLTLPPYKGSTLRGGFGHAFKKTVCTIRGKPCDDCLLKTRCIYSYVFETPPPEDSQILRKYEKVPHPFVIEPPLETRRLYKPGDTLEFGLILIGRAIDYLPYFIYTFDELGKMGIGKGKGTYELQDVRCKIHDDNERIIYSGEDKKLYGDYQTVALQDILDLQATDTVSLNFLTPTRIIVNADLVVDVEFHHLIRSLLRRISTLSYFHCGKRLELDFKGLIERASQVKVRDRATRWYDWERYSARQDTRMKMGGFVGKACFEGDLGEFIPFIKLGELLHVGKGTSFGLGKYSLKS